MSLAAIVGIYLLSIGYPGLGRPVPGVRGFVAQQPAGIESSTQQSPPSDPGTQPQTQPSQSQSTEPTPTSPSPAGQAATPSDQAKQSPARTRRHKKKNLP